jgi:hypothetical protein
MIGFDSHLLPTRHQVRHIRWTGQKAKDQLERKWNRMFGLKVVHHGLYESPLLVNLFASRLVPVTGASPERTTL